MPKKLTEVYISIDVEADGPIPGPHSMLSIGAAAFTEKGDLLGTFHATLDNLPGAVGDPDTMTWWAKYPDAWKAAREGTRPPPDVMKEFVEWVEAKPGTPVCVAFPVGFDFMFAYWYMRQFVGRSPFSFSSIDGKTYAMAMMRKPYRRSGKSNMPRRWFDKSAKHTHVAVDDAIEQGRLFMNMLRENLAAEKAHT